MSFLAEYGLFFLKALTIVVAFISCLIGLMVVTRKSRPKFEIISLNKQFSDIKARMIHTIVNKKEAKAYSKKIAKEDKKNPNLYVIDFNGDIKASQVEELREDINCVLAIAKEQDEVVIRLESPGGAVNGYGLAAAQLQRLRNRNLPLTVCIDKVAASGGYLMSCVANTIVAAPFAIVGSIGVVAQLPNFHRWLKKHDIDVELITSGEHKRTLTFLGENTEKGRKKFQEDVEKIHDAFRTYVLAHRPNLDIEKIATGEHWLATDALALNLVDSLQTSDDFLLERMDRFNIYKLTHHTKQSAAAKILKPFFSTLRDSTKAYFVN